MAGFQHPGFRAHGTFSRGAAVLLGTLAGVGLSLAVAGAAWGPAPGLAQPAASFVCPDRELVAHTKHDTVHFRCVSSDGQRGRADEVELFFLLLALYGVPCLGTTLGLTLMLSRRDAQLAGQR